MDSQSGDPNASGSSEYSSYGRRMAAALLDTVIIGVVTSVLCSALWFLFHDDLRTLPHTLTARGQVVAGSILAIAIVVPWLNEAFFLSSALQATLGKQILHLRVTNEHNERITFARATARHFAFWSSFILTLVIIVEAANSVELDLSGLLPLPGVLNLLTPMMATALVLSLPIALDRSRRALHDRLTGTLVTMSA